MTPPGFKRNLTSISKPHRPKGLGGNAGKVLKGLAVTDEELSHLIGDVVLRFQNDNFEHQHSIKRRTATFRLLRKGSDETLPNQHRKQAVGGNY